MAQIRISNIARERIAREVAQAAAEAFTREFAKEEDHVQIPWPDAAWGEEEALAVAERWPDRVEQIGTTLEAMIAKLVNDYTNQSFEA